MNEKSCECGVCQMLSETRPPSQIADKAMLIRAYEAKTQPFSRHLNPLFKIEAV